MSTVQDPPTAECCSGLAPLPGLFELERPEQIEALLEPLNQEVLRALLAAPSSVGELAGQVRLPLRAVHYRVTRLESLGFVRVQSMQPRRGRPIKIYAPTAQDGWRFPFSRSKALSLSDLALLYMQQHGREFWEEAERRIPGELWVSFERYGPRNAGFNLQTADPQHDEEVFSRVVSGWYRVHLSDAEAQDLAGRLQALLSEYAFRDPEPGKREHLLGTFLVDRSSV